MDIIACLAVMVVELIAILWLVVQLRKAKGFALSSDFSAAFISAAQCLLVMDALKNNDSEKAAAQLEESLDDSVVKLADLLARGADSSVPSAREGVERLYGHIRRLKQARASVEPMPARTLRMQANKILGLTDGI